MHPESPAPEPTAPELGEVVATEATVSATTRPRARRGRRVLAVVAGVAMVPALYAAASAVTGGGERPNLSVAAHSADDPVGSGAGSEIEVEHGVTTVKPDDSATPPSPPTTPTVPGSDDDSTSTPTGPTTPENEPGDDNPSEPVPAPAEPVTQTFVSDGGSIDVTLADGSLALGAVTPAAGYTVEVHDGGGSRVEVRFFDADGKEWRIRVEVSGGAMTQEITFHG
jgi:hypothetical protein